MTPLSAGLIAKYAPHLALDLELPPPRSPVLAAILSTASISASVSDLGSGEGSAEASVSGSSTSTLVSLTDPYDKAADATLGGLESPTSLNSIATVAIPYAEDPAYQIGTELERVGGQSLVEMERGKKRERTMSVGASTEAAGWVKRSRTGLVMDHKMSGDGDEAEGDGDTTEDDEYEVGDISGVYGEKPTVAGADGAWDFRQASRQREYLSWCERDLLMFQDSHQRRIRLQQ